MDTGLSGNSLSNALLLFALCSFWAALIFMAWNRSKQKRAWAALPTLQDYIRRDSTLKTENGVRCFSCTSQNIRNWGLFRASDDRRVFICNNCGMKLYRSA